MGVESVFNYTEKIKAIDVKWDGIKDWLKENIIKQKAINYVNANRKSLNKEELNLLINKIDILLRKQDIEKLNLKSKFEELKKQTIIESKINISKVKKLDIHDIKSPAWLSHYIDKSWDEKMKALEEYLWVDNLWKIIALTTIYTWKEVWKWFTDILKIWEWAAEWSLALDRNDLSTL